MNTSNISNIVDARLAAAQARVAAAEHELERAVARADYHNWNGSSSRAWKTAREELNEARKALRELQKIQRDEQRKGGAA